MNSTSDTVSSRADAAGSARSWLIDVEGLAALLENGGDCVVLDCRFDLLEPEAGRNAYRQQHIPGAVYVDLDHDLAVPVTASSGRHPLPTVAEAARRFGELGVHANSAVVVYDAGNGAIAARAWWMLRWLGMQDVRLLNGGFAAWLRAGLATASGDQSMAARMLQPEPAAGWVLGVRDIENTLTRDDGMLLFDARDADRFAGRSEPIDSVAGHIPGAINFPLADSLRDDGLWKSRSELRALWRQRIGSNPDAKIAVMCGSGVTACHLALSAQQAGIAMPKVYIGSWSEWIRDPRRPVKTVPERPESGNRRE